MQDKYMILCVAGQSNAVNGTGAITALRQSHFGNNAFQGEVAPRVAEAIRKRL